MRKRINERIQLIVLAIHFVTFNKAATDLAMDQKKNIQIVSRLLVLTGINTCKTNNLSKKILHKIYVFLISLTFVYDFQRYIRLTTLEDLTHLIPFISFLNHIVSISCTWLLLMQNLMFPRDLDQVFREFSAIDRILECNFHIKIGYARIRKNFPSYASEFSCSL